MVSAESKKNSFEFINMTKTKQLHMLREKNSLFSSVAKILNDLDRKKLSAFLENVSTYLHKNKYWV